jgi:alkyl sulfatase BDS1-like metallo-beta-lactamase superfamily hydrolase
VRARRTGQEMQMIKDEAAPSIAAQHLTVTGDIGILTQLTAVLDPGDPGFNIVRP